MKSEGSINGLLVEATVITSIKILTVCVLWLPHSSIVFHINSVFRLSSFPDDGHVRSWSRLVLTFLQHAKWGPWETTVLWRKRRSHPGTHKPFHLWSLRNHCVVKSPSTDVISKALYSHRAKFSYRLISEFTDYPNTISFLG